MTAAAAGASAAAAINADLVAGKLDGGAWWDGRDYTVGATPALVLADERVVRALAGVPVRRVVVVPGRLVNIVTG